LVIQNLKIIGFRNLNEYRVSFCKGKNLIHGVNGAGKTSVLEAVFMLGFGKSFLNVKKADIVKNGSPRFLLQSEVVDPGGRINTVNALYEGNFLLHVNDKKSTIFDVNAYLYPLIFSSSNYNLYIESRTYIRKLMDRFIFGVNPLYLHTLLSYNKALKQKNYLLKTRVNVDEIRSWNKIIGEMSQKITGIKMEFIDSLNEEIDRKFSTGPRVRYLPSFPVDPDNRGTFFQNLEKLIQTEIMAKRSLIGPHLDNFEIHSNRKNLKFFSSGEKKINLLMIYIAFIEFFKARKNDYPVFLVDDFDTAIDTGNIEFLIENCPDMQVIATSVTESNGFDRLIELKKEN